MAKAQSPLLGYNTNVRHKGRVFHIQTEDSGVARPHVITHLFADGGRVLKTSKTSYADLLGADDVPALVKKLMQDQHKGMFVALRDGHFDGQFEAAPSAAEPVPEPIAAAPDELAVAPAAIDDEIEIDESQFIEPIESLPTLQADFDVSETIPVPIIVPPAPALRSPTPSATSAAPLARAPLAPAPAAPLPATGSSKPPPLRPVARPPAVSVRPPLASRPVAPVAPVAASAPASPFASKQSASFGERLVSERSLDEVILAYLAEELDDPRAR